jgi:hypothetical protein
MMVVRRRRLLLLLLELEPRDYFVVRPTPPRLGAVLDAADVPRVSSERVHVDMVNTIERRYVEGEAAVRVTHTVVVKISEREVRARGAHVVGRVGGVGGVLLLFPWGVLHRVEHVWVRVEHTVADRAHATHQCDVVHGELVDVADVGARHDEDVGRHDRVERTEDHERVVLVQERLVSVAQDLAEAARDHAAVRVIPDAFPLGKHPNETM